MRVIIVDDEALARTRLRSLVEELQEHEVVAEASNGREAVERIEELQPDLALLDIRMPGMDGLEVAIHLMSMERPPAVIFVTAFDQHALDAFDANAVDYLLKPVRKERLQKALEKVHLLNRNQISELQKQEELSSARSHICVRSRGRVQLIPIGKIIYFMADQKYVTIYSSEGEALIEEALKSLEDEFTEAFIRIHRNALVARTCLVGMEKLPDGGYTAILKGTDNRLEISRRHVPGVRKILRDLG